MSRFTALAISVISGCYAPEFASCRTACETALDCAPGHSCTSAGLCAAAGQHCEIDAAIDGAPDAAEVVGTYAMVITNRENGCAFPSWQAEATSNLDVVISRHGDVLIGEPIGPVATFLDAWLGTHVYAGQATAGGLVLVLAGTKLMMKGSCAYTYDASFSGVMSDQLRGDIRYEARTNGAASCAALTGCSTRQSFAGPRIAP